LAEYATIMRNEAVAAASAWREGAALNVTREMLGLVTTISAKSLFSAGTRADIVAEIQQSFPVLAAGTGKRAMAPLGVLYKLPLPANRRYNMASQRFNQLVDRIIADYRAAGIQQGDLLAMLMAARDEDTGQAMDDTQIHDECTAILGASTETVSNTLSWVWYVLDSRPDIEERVHAEIDEILGGRPAGHDEVASLQYVQRVVAETLRLYPPLWLSTRIATTDVDLGGYRIPAGADVFFSSYAMQRDAAIYPEPGRFDPDRWLPERHRDIDRDSYLPFGGGARQCIGNTFALTETAILIGTLAGQWRLRAVPGQQTRPRAQITLSPNPLVMVTERRGRR
jgi:cytochrome P450